MNTEERIRTHLKDTTSGLRSPDHLDQIMAEGRRRRGQTRIASALSLAAAVVAVVMFGSNLIPGGEGELTVATNPTETTVSPTTTPETTIGSQEGNLTPVDEVAGVILADQNGVTISDSAGKEVAHLVSDRFYSEISVAYPDQLGGLIFQHAVTPLPWPNGAILQLRSESATPDILVTPPEGGYLIPVGPAVSETGSPAFVYLEQTLVDAELGVAIKLVDLTSKEVTEIAPLGIYSDVSAGGDLVAIINRENECATISLVGTDGSERPSPIPDCLPIGIGVAVSSNAETLAILVNGELRVIDVADGSTLTETTIADSYMVTSGPGGWIVRTSTETQVIDKTGTTSMPPIEQGWTVPYGSELNISPDATLGNGSGELPCVRYESELVDQELPAAVSATRSSIFNAAANCDYEALATLALDNEATVSFGSPPDPAAFWVAEGRRGREPLGLIARLLNTTPAHDPDYGAWAWPAVHQDPTDEASWAELETIMGVDAVAELRAYPNYLELRVGITDAGQWQYAVAGD